VRDESRRRVARRAAAAGGRRRPQRGAAQRGRRLERHLAPARALLCPPLTLVLERGCCPALRPRVQHSLHGAHAKLLAELRRRRRRVRRRRVGSQRGGDAPRLFRLRTLLG